MDERSRTALIVGATGLVGAALIDILLEQDRYQEVISLVRRPSGKEHPDLREVVTDFDNLTPTDHLLKISHVFCCLGTTIKSAGSKEAFYNVDFNYVVNIARIAKNNGASQFNVISSLGANANSRIFYNRVKGEMQEALVKLDYNTLNIFQPSLLLGDRKETRIGENIGKIIVKLIKPVLVGPLLKYRGIHAQTVARAMFNVANEEDMGVHIYPSDLIAKMAE